MTMKEIGDEHSASHAADGATGCCATLNKMRGGINRRQSPGRSQRQETINHLWWKRVLIALRLRFALSNMKNLEKLGILITNND